MSEIDKYKELYKEAKGPDGSLIYAGQLLARAAKKWPNKIALIVAEDNENLPLKKLRNGFGITYKDLFEASLKISNQLKKSNVKLNAPVALIYENSIEFYIAYYAIWQMGAVVASINHFLNPFEIEKILHLLEPVGVIVSNNVFKNMKDALEGINLILTQDDIYKILEKKEKIAPKEILKELDGDKMSVLLYTSGTTGTPKGVMLSSNGILENMIQGITSFNLAKNDRAFAVLPLFHSYMQNTCVWSCIFVGVPAVIVPSIDRKSILAGLKLNPTVILGIPQLYGLFCLLKKIKFGKVRYFISGGDALSDKIRMGFEIIYRRKICNGYGLTETGPFISVDFDDVVKPMDTVGRPMINVECQIREGDKVLGKNKVGVLWVKGKNLMLGYYKMPEETEKVLVDGWFNTGDLAKINDNGKIVLAGREKDLIKVKGVQVYPQAIENVLMKHADVRAAGVIGKFEEDKEIIVAFIESKNKDNNFEKELRELCEKYLANYEIPKIFIIKDNLPKTATGKIDKKSLKKELKN